MTKKYVGKDGGRYIYNQDLEAIQDVGFAVAEAIFSSFGNMVIGGVEISEDSKEISKGTVYINGYIRKFSGSKISKLPVYLYESNREETVQYQDEQSKVGRIVYGVAITDKEPTDTIDPVTGKKVEYITLTSNLDKNPTLKNSFFGKHSLLKNTSNAQGVSGDVSFFGTSTFESDTFFKQAAKIGVTSITGYVDKMVFAVKDEDAVSISSDGEIKFLKSKVSINKSGIETVQLRASKLLLNEDGVATVDGSELMINKSAFKKENSFSIFDGINRLIRYVANSSVVKFLKKITVNKEIEIENTSLGKDMDGYTASIIFTDKTKAESFSIKTTEAGTVVKSKGITIDGAAGINLESEKVMENGILLSERYANLKTYNSDKKTFVTKVDGKGLSDKNYTDAEKNKLAAIKTSSLSDEDGLGYVTAQDVNDELEGKLSIDKNLSDLDLDSDDKKRAVCNTLGAAFLDDVEKKRKDTGWVKLSHPTNGELHNLFARQIGNQVWIQGNLKTSSAVGGVFAKIPNSISPPAYDVYASFHEISNKGDNRGLSVMIKKATVNLIEYERAKYEGHTAIININYLIN